MSNRIDNFRFKNTYTVSNTGIGITKEFWTKEGTILYTAGQENKYTNYPNIPEKMLTGPNDLLVARNGAGAVQFPIQGAIYTDHVIRFSVKNDFNRKFLYYCLLTGMDKIVGGASTVSLATLNKSDWDNVIVPNISTIEQQKIVGFLDKKIVSINEIIAKTSQSIDKLKIYKHAFVTDAVTKGINKNVNMKESGIEWVGKIPEHWKVPRLKELFHIFDERNEDESARLLSLYTAIGVRPRDELEGRGNKAQTVINYKKVFLNDLVVNKLLAWMGAIGYSDYVGVTSPDYDVYRARKNSPVERRFYQYYFRNTDFKTDCYKYGRGIMLMRWRTYPEQFLKIIVANPPIEEQIQIADYLDEKIGSVDELILKKQQLIEKFEQYKKSLIYECVTGKRN
jgi:type I restriction enzyme, S subunit